MTDDADTIIYAVKVYNSHHDRCHEMKTQQLLDPALRVYFKGLISGGLTATQALSLYEESLLGEQFGKVALAREKVRFYSSPYCVQ